MRHAYFILYKVGSYPINDCQIHIITVIIDVRNFRTKFLFGSLSTWFNLGDLLPLRLGLYLKNIGKSKPNENF